jgi:hypothetical protein
VKWVFKVKRDEHRAVSKHKAHLVVKGYGQRHGIDYDEIFASVARLDLVHLLIALATHEGVGGASYGHQISVLEW